MKQISHLWNIDVFFIKSGVNDITTFATFLVFTQIINQLEPFFGWVCWASLLQSIFNLLIILSHCKHMITVNDQSVIHFELNMSARAHTHTDTPSLPHQSVIWSSSSKHSVVSSPSCAGSRHETLAWLIQCAQSALGNWSCYQHTSDIVQSSLSPPALDPSMPQSLVSLLPWYRGTECPQGG